MLNSNPYSLFFVSVCCICFEIFLLVYIFLLGKLVINKGEENGEGEEYLVCELGVESYLKIGLSVITRREVPSTLNHLV